MTFGLISFFFDLQQQRYAIKISTSRPRTAATTTIGTNSSAFSHWQVPVDGELHLFLGQELQSESHQASQVARPLTMFAEYIFEFTKVCKKFENEVCVDEFVEEAVREITIPDPDGPARGSSTIDVESTPSVVTLEIPVPVTLVKPKDCNSDVNSPIAIPVAKVVVITLETFVGGGFILVLTRRAAYELRSDRLV